MEWDDGDWESYYTHPDEENWERYRTEKVHVVHDLIDFLFKLGVLRPKVGSVDLPHYEYDAYGFVDRNWKVLNDGKKKDILLD